jgi:hypothetical protein
MGRISLIFLTMFDERHSVKPSLKRGNTAPYLARVAGLLELWSARRELPARPRRRARRHHGAPSGHRGSVTFVQRFDSALNLTPHFHSFALDGVYAGPADSLDRFPLPKLIFSGFILFQFRHNVALLKHMW